MTLKEVLNIIISSNEFENVVDSPKGLSRFISKLDFEPKFHVLYKNKDVTSNFLVFFIKWLEENNIKVEKEYIEYSDEIILLTYCTSNDGFKYKFSYLKHFEESNYRNALRTLKSKFSDEWEVRGM